MTLDRPFRLMEATGVEPAKQGLGIPRHTPACATPGRLNGPALFAQAAGLNQLLALQLPGNVMELAGVEPVKQGA